MTNISISARWYPVGAIIMLIATVLAVWILSKFPIHRNGNTTANRRPVLPSRSQTFTIAEQSIPSQVIMRPKNHFIARLLRSKGKESTEKNAEEAFVSPSPLLRTDSLSAASPPSLGVFGGGIVPPPVAYERGGGTPLKAKFPEVVDSASSD
jgi:hypothetical protein